MHAITPVSAADGFFGGLTVINPMNYRVLLSCRQDNLLPHWYPEAEYSVANP